MDSLPLLSGGDDGNMGRLEHKDAVEQVMRARGALSSSQSSPTVIAGKTPKGADLIFNRNLDLAAAASTGDSSAKLSEAHLHAQELMEVADDVYAYLTMGSIRPDEGKTDPDEATENGDLVLSNVAFFTSGQMNSILKISDNTKKLGMNLHLPSQPKLTASDSSMTHNEDDRVNWAMECRPGHYQAGGKKLPELRALAIMQAHGELIRAASGLGSYATSKFFKEREPLVKEESGSYLTFGDAYAYKKYLEQIECLDGWSKSYETVTYIHLAYISHHKQGGDTSKKSPALAGISRDDQGTLHVIGKRGKDRHIYRHGKDSKGAAHDSSSSSYAAATHVFSGDYGREPGDGRVVASEQDAESRQLADMPNFDAYSFKAVMVRPVSTRPDGKKGVATSSALLREPSQPFSTRPDPARDLVRSIKQAATTPYVSLYNGEWLCQKSNCDGKIVPDRLVGPYRIPKAALPQEPCDACGEMINVYAAGHHLHRSEQMIKADESQIASQLTALAGHWDKAGSNVSTLATVAQNILGDSGDGTALKDLYNQLDSDLESRKKKARTVSAIGVPKRNVKAYRYERRELHSKLLQVVTRPQQTAWFKLADEIRGTASAPSPDGKELLDSHRDSVRMERTRHGMETTDAFDPKAGPAAVRSEATNFILGLLGEACNENFKCHILQAFEDRQTKVNATTFYGALPNGSILALDMRYPLPIFESLLLFHDMFGSKEKAKGFIGGLRTMLREADTEQKRHDIARFALQYIKCQAKDDTKGCSIEQGFFTDAGKMVRVTKLGETGAAVGFKKSDGKPRYTDKDFNEIVNLAQAYRSGMIEDQDDKKKTAKLLAKLEAFLGAAETKKQLGE